MAHLKWSQLSQILYLGKNSFGSITGLITGQVSLSGTGQDPWSLPFHPVFSGGNVCGSEIFYVPFCNLEGGREYAYRISCVI